MSADTDNYRFLCVDPGEETGWSIWRGDKLLGGGQTKLWDFAHDFADAVVEDIGPLSSGAMEYMKPGVSEGENSGPFGLLLYEIFALYPWKAKELAFDEFRTVQLIGALKIFADRYNIPVHSQSAQIKERAQAGGVEEFYVSPRVENRHQNDSIQHGWYYRQVEVHGRRLG